MARYSSTTPCRPQDHEIPAQALSCIVVIDRLIEVFGLELQSPYVHKILP
jgi:hypothetical protein